MVLILCRKGYNEFRKNHLSSLKKFTYGLLSFYRRVKSSATTSKGFEANKDPDGPWIFTCGVLDDIFYIVFNKLLHLQEHEIRNIWSSEPLIFCPFPGAQLYARNLAFSSSKYRYSTDWYRSTPLWLSTLLYNSLINIFIGSTPLGLSIILCNSLFNISSLSSVTITSLLEWAKSFILTLFILALLFKVFNTLKCVDLLFVD